MRAAFLPAIILILLSITALSDHIKMSQCPLGFKGTPPPGHPKVAGLDTSSSGSKAAASTSSTSGDAGWNPWLLLALDAAFILLAIYIARNGVPRAIADPVKAAFTRTRQKVDAKVE